MPVVVVVLCGGFVVNGLWCLFLNVKNKTIGDYVEIRLRRCCQPVLCRDWPGRSGCSQFVCFKTGEPAMGKISYVGWSVLFASCILFGTLLGILLGEWKKTSGRTRLLLALGLVLSGCVIGHFGLQRPPWRQGPAA